MEKKLYCVRCGAKTVNASPLKYRTTANNRKQAYTTCKKCATKKFQFVAS